MEKAKLGILENNSICIYTYPGFASNIIFEMYES